MVSFQVEDNNVFITFHHPLIIQSETIPRLTGPGSPQCGDLQSCDSYAPLTLITYKETDKIGFKDTVLLRQISPLFFMESQKTNTCTYEAGTKAAAKLLRNMPQTAV